MARLRIRVRGRVQGVGLRPFVHLLAARLGLGGWVRNDADGDGQVVMSEYTATWSESKAAEFAKYDLDSDGVITPRECLRTLELEATRKSSSSSSSSSSRP